MSSRSFDAEDVRPRHLRDHELTTPTTPGMSASQLSTPVMSQLKAFGLVLNTPPPANTRGDKVVIDASASLKNNDRSSGDAPAALPRFPSQKTPDISAASSQYDALEPPTWKPPENEEVEYTDAWNSIYNAQHHYLQPGFAQDDSTIGSSQTNSSFTNNVGIHALSVLRPRGLSICSYTDDPSIGSCPTKPQARGQAQHRRHPSLPVSFFSSARQQGSQSQQLFPLQHGSQSQLASTSKQKYLNLLKPTTKSSPYELHSRHHVSQVQADGAMAGLKGVMLDLYMVDRYVDRATANMLATKGQWDSTVHDSNNVHGDAGAKEERPLPKRKPRKTSVGTLGDIQCILDLHKVDKVVDRFKRGLQMPEFSEEEAREDDVWKELRKTDVEMEEHAGKKKSKDDGNGKRKEARGRGRDQIHYQFDLSDNEEGRWNDITDEVLSGEDVYSTAESFLADYDAYQFFDPRETEALQANAYQSSQVSASISDDLNEIIDLLRTDAEVDGASRYHKEMDMISPLLEVDREIDGWTQRSKMRDMWDANLRALYLTDLEVDRSKGNRAAKSRRAEVNSNTVHTVHLESTATRVETVKPQDPTPPTHATETRTDQEVKDMLAQHIPQVSQPFCQTSPEHMASKASFHGSNLYLPPPPGSVSSPQSTRREISSTQEKTNANVAPKASVAKRSIFSRKEKSSAASKCAYQRGIMMPGTTTVVMAKGGEMIDDIPVGRVVATHGADASHR